jgi:hypothetical protein
LERGGGVAALADTPTLEHLSPGLPKRIIPRVTKSLTLWLAIAGTALAAGPLHAHHGQAAYDREKVVSVTGTVTRFEFVNPHVLIHVGVPSGGKTVEWSGELTSPNRLARLALGDVKWHKDLLHPGDEVTLTGNPARNGAPALYLTKVVDGAGKALIGGGP